MLRPLHERQGDTVPAPQLNICSLMEKPLTPVAARHKGFVLSACPLINASRKTNDCPVKLCPHTCL